MSHQHDWTSYSTTDDRTHSRVSGLGEDASPLVLERLHIPDPDGMIVRSAGQEPAGPGRKVDSRRQLVLRSMFGREFAHQDSVLVLAQGGKPVNGIDRADRDRAVFRARGQDLVREPVDVVCLVRGMMFPAVLELDGYNTDVPYACLAVDIGRGEIIAVRIPSDTGDLPAVSVTSTL